MKNEQQVRIAVGCEQSDIEANGLHALPQAV
jgi:hypothetical protein